MTIRERFNTFYRPSFIVALVLFGGKYILGLIDNDTYLKSLNGILTTIGFIIVLTIILGLIYQWFEVYRPNRERKLFDKIKQLDFEKFGLQINEDFKKIYGNYKGYYVEISTNAMMDDGDWLVTSALIKYDENQNEIFLKLKDKYELLTYNNEYWLICRTKIKYRKRDLIENFSNDINRFINTLMQKNIDPAYRKE